MQKQNLEPNVAVKPGGGIDCSSAKIKGPSVFIQYHLCVHFSKSAGRWRLFY